MIGLDGATYNVLDKWVSSGDMPNLADLMERGTRTVLTSTVPPVTGPAWTSMVTGVNPGSHGVFDFFKWSIDGTTGRLVTSRDVPLPRMWDVAGAAGRSVGVFNVPITFPAWPVNGFMVTGMLTPAPGPAMTHPAAVHEELTERDICPFGKPKKEGSERQFMSLLLNKHAINVEAMTYLLKKHEPDFFMGVFLGPDRLQHHLWSYCVRAADADDPTLRSRVLEYFRTLDDAIGRLMRFFGEDATFYVVSDHGFGPVRGTCRLNNYLAEKGFLEFDDRRSRRLRRRLGTWRVIKTVLTSLGLWDFAKRRLLQRASGDRKRERGDLARRLDMMRLVDWGKTSAYLRSRSECGIVVNLRGKCPNGIVEPGEDYERVCQNLTDVLRELKDPESGENIVEYVFRKEDVLSGPFLTEAPDLYVFSNGSHVMDNEMGGPLFVKGRLRATHRGEGVLIACGPNVKRGAQLDANIMDVAPTALHGMGLSVPEHMEGKVLTDLFEDGFLAAHPVEYCDHQEPPFGSDSEPPHSPEMDAQVVAALRQLGYL